MLIFIIVVIIAVLSIAFNLIQHQALHNKDKILIAVISNYKADLELVCGLLNFFAGRMANEEHEEEEAQATLEYFRKQQSGVA